MYAPIMTKGTKTLLYVLGGLAVVGGGTAAIIYATKKPDAGASGSNTVVPNPGPGQGSNPTPSPTSVIQTTAPEINALLSLAQALAQAQKKPDFGQVTPGL